jgi:hypothetical protein
MDYLQMATRMETRYGSEKGARPKKKKPLPLASHQKKDASCATLAACGSIQGFKGFRV